MTEQRWVRVTAEGNIPVREGRAVRIDGREIAIFNLGDRFLAADNQCPHANGPLCDGIVTGVSVVCPLHAWKVNLTSGRVERPGETGRCVRTYRTCVQAGVVLVEFPAGSTRLGAESAVSPAVDNETVSSTAPVEDAVALVGRQLP